MTDQASPQPKTSWGLGAKVKGFMGDLPQRMVVKTNLGDLPTPAERGAAIADATTRLYAAIIANEAIARLHRPQMIDGELYLTHPILGRRMKVTFETFIIVE